MDGKGERKYGVWHDHSDIYPSIGGMLWSIVATFFWLAVPVVAVVIFVAMCIAVLING